MRKKLAEPKLDLHCCEHCGTVITDRTDGGWVLLPTAVSGLRERKVYLHNRCFREYIQLVEARRQQITGYTVFERDGSRRQLPGESEVRHVRG